MFVMVRQRSNIAKKRIQGQSDSPLTDLGCKQATRLGKRLSDFSISSITSSGLGRANQTAAILAQELGLEVYKDLRFQETSFGEVEGMTWKQVQDRYPELSSGWRNHESGLSMPGGETREEVILRTLKGLESLLDPKFGDLPLVVTHGGVLAAIFCHILRIPWGTKPACTIENTSINILQWDKKMENQHLG